MNLMEEIGLALRNAREEKGYSTIKLGKLCGKDCSHITCIENGRYSTIKTVEDILKPLGKKLAVVDSDNPIPEPRKNTTRRESYGGGEFTKERIEQRAKERNERRRIRAEQRALRLSKIAEKNKDKISVSHPKKATHFGFIKKV